MGKTNNLITQLSLYYTTLQKVEEREEEDYQIRDYRRERTSKERNIKEKQPAIDSQLVFNNLFQIIYEHPELKSFNLNSDDIAVISFFCYKISKEYQLDFSFEEIIRIFPDKDWDFREQIEFIQSLIYREILSFSNYPLYGSAEDINLILYKHYSLNSLIFHILLGKSPIKESRSIILNEYEKRPFIETVCYALNHLFDSYNELNLVDSECTMYYGRTINKLLSTALRVSHKLKSDNPYKIFVHTYGLDSFWQKCLLLIYKYNKSEKIIDYRILSALLSENKEQFNHFTEKMLHNNPLQQAELLEKPGLFSSNGLVLSNSAIKELFEYHYEGIDIRTYLSSSPYFSLISPEQTLNQLILPADSFQSVVSIINQLKNPDLDTLASWGLITASLSDGKETLNGCNILLYGEPGTGKTYIAGIIANELNKPLLKINTEAVRSHYYSDTEKSARKLFKNMRQLHEKIAPVFLLNEGDSLMHCRNTYITTTVDSEENALQSVFLEELETFPGILIVTTNLRENLDYAIFRRFRYKLEIPVPDYDCRLKLWKLHLNEEIPGSAKIDLTSLAQEFSLTGGEIRNVVLNACHHLISNPDLKELTYDILYYYARMESSSNLDKRNKEIGFRN